MKPNLYFVVDIETTMRHRMTFDVAWSVIDKHGNQYGKGSYIVLEAFQYDVPFFKEKLGFYFSDTYRHMIEPKSMNEIRDLFNAQVDNFKALGHKVYFCAYNVAFDAKYLGESCETFAGTKFLAVPIDGIFDIWYNWGMNVPLNYFLMAAKTDKGNYKTSAEWAYRYENQDENFIEAHIAWQDVVIETKILTKTLARKKKMYIAQNKSEIKGNVWRLINNRAPERQLAA